MDDVDVRNAITRNANTRIKIKKADDFLQHRILQFMESDDLKVENFDSIILKSDEVSPPPSE